jgi:hypothetical protein
MGMGALHWPDANRLPNGDGTLTFERNIQRFFDFSPFAAIGMDEINQCFFTSGS